MRLLAGYLLSLVMLLAQALAADGKPSVSFELLTQPGLSLTASQQWYKALTELGVSGLQIRSAGPRDEMGIKQSGGKGSPQFKVTGILATDNTLHVPGGKFAVNETGRLRKWLAKLGDEGVEGIAERPAAFGLSARQLDEIHDDLKPAVDFSTKGMAATKAVNRIGRLVKHSLSIDESAARDLAGVDVADELQGLSAGTALAAIVRPAGLALVPERSGGESRYRIARPRAGRDGWPVGWKPKEGAVRPLPDLFEYLNVEIQDTAVPEAVAAIESRLKAPVLFDRSAMAQHGVDPSKVIAAVPSKRMTYSQILNKVLMQARLKYELRVDEAEKPFLWITTIKPTS